MLNPKIGPFVRTGVKVAGVVYLTPAPLFLSVVLNRLLTFIASGPISIRPPLSQEFFTGPISHSIFYRSLPGESTHGSTPTSADLGTGSIQS